MSWALVLVGIFMLLCLYVKRSFSVAKNSRPPPPPKPNRKKAALQKADVVVFYASQTGTAEGFARKLAKEMNSACGKSASAVDIEEFMAKHVGEYDSLPEQIEGFARGLKNYKLTVIITATYGEGDPTDNSIGLYKMLLAASPLGSAEGAGMSKTVFPPVSEEYQTAFQGFEFAVYGLGDRNYEHFNAMGKFFDDRFEKMGGKRLLVRGEGDDANGGIEDDFNEWKTSLFGTLRGESGAGAGILEYQGHKFTFGMGYPLRFMHRLESAGAGVAPPSLRPGLSLATVAVNKELHTAQSDRSCVHMELDITGRSLRYVAGDHVGIYPHARPEHVATLARLLHVEDKLDAVFEFPRSEAGAEQGTGESEDQRESSVAEAMSVFARTPFTLREAFTTLIDVQSSPSQSFLLALAESCSNEQEKVRLYQMASREGKQLYKDEILNRHVSILHILELFPSASLNLGQFLELAPRMKVRYYSISSSPRVHPNSIHVTCAIVREPHPNGGIYEGLCSTWLQRMPVGAKCAVYIRKSTFHLPPQLTTPILMFGPGTGLAPFRAFLQERQMHRRDVALSGLDADSFVGASVLYFGCRDRNKDYIYRQELEEMSQDGTISSLHLAFSREPQTAPTRKYVQHLLTESAREAWSLIQDGAYIYICGDAKAMSTDVQHVLTQVIEKEGHKTRTQADEMMRKLKKDGRLLLDVW
eukprot:TRINITY_DN1171_c0_g1::TRINITY_DN1171_c0_g1_i1::g.17301::m.17301 TRINITY_DN1171_c0_g1::TRINITY_DN1171_c0_g1_i1::g.17301  ORF type:complete len:699 (+),score=115.51,sp/Q9SB48/NCPR1_ARATH/35.73/3e-122,FAD_binding_1/PF00667.15/4.9e-60,Flavodoxin_1/PF00258.20/2.2e-27,Flavodoxin_1/PF00258.20/2.5e+03,NAD_binding_1/PF00175.16/2.4e+03,NAD_binding_1/PF00175.16/7e-16,Flavodoxin_5/PF12724.2/0.23 TRINITY_DN1171_c0_g1_i1:68-2164(+)